MQEYLFDWAYNYPLPPGEPSTEVSLYYLQGGSTEAIVWAESLHYVDCFKQCYEEEGFVPVATVHLREEVFHEGLPEENTFRHMLRDEEYKQGVRYLLIMSQA